MTEPGPWIWLAFHNPVLSITEASLLSVVLLTPLFLDLGAPLVPSKRRRVQKIPEFETHRPGEFWIDLGAGDGRVVIAAAKAGARSLGFEINPILVLWAKLMIRWANIWNADISGADVLSMYLMPYRMKRVQDKIESEAKPGCRVVVHDFALPDWKPVAQDDKIMLYVKPGPPPAGARTQNRPLRS